MAKASPTQRTLKLMRDQGWLCQVVERWLPARGTMKFPRRIDVYGFADILACRERTPEDDGSRPQIALVQTCAGGDAAKRRAKILAEPRAGVWMRSGGYILLVSWSKRGKRGDPKEWTPKIEQL